MMDRVLGGFLGKFVAVYLDDIIVFSNTWEEHYTHLSLVLERLEADLRPGEMSTRADQHRVLGSYDYA